jgi:dihydropteroate synthase
LLEGIHVGCYRSDVGSVAHDPHGGTGVRAWLRGDAAREGHVRPAIVGVLNVTPDSFSDGGRFLDPSAALAHAARLLEDGADVIEVGGESTRPAGPAYGGGYAPVADDVQRARVLPVIEGLARLGARVAIDTTSPVVAAAALAAGATIVSDVSCLKHVELARVVAERRAWLVLMHSRPGAASHYDDLFGEVAHEFSAARDRAVAAGVAPAHVLFDPGLGFGKGPDDNLRLLAGLARFHALGHPIYVGPSRKSFIATAEERAFGRTRPPHERLGGTLAASLRAARAGAAALRVHDVAELAQALAVEAAIEEAGHQDERPSQHQAVASSASASGGASGAGRGG